jgi:hypothetical protein
VSTLVALLVMALGLAMAPALLSPAEGAVHHGRRAHAHTTVKAARFVSNIRNVQGALNQCRGPVAWNSRGEGAPWLMFEHDYCGGAWALSTRAGDRLQIRNGPLAGTWRANGRVRLVSRGAMVSTTRGLGYLVVQTCVPGSSRMRLVGFDRAS